MNSTHNNMDAQDFKTFCHELFLRYGFIKIKKSYYLKCKDLLCGICLSRSMAEAYYVDLRLYIGEYEDKKSYPATTPSDIHICFTVPSKCTDRNGNYFMDGCIEYPLYTKEEIEPYFVNTIEKYILPLKTKGTKYILENQEFYLKAVFKRDIEKVLNKLYTAEKTRNHSLSSD